MKNQLPTPTAAAHATRATQRNASGNSERREHVGEADDERRDDQGKCEAVRDLLDALHDRVEADGVHRDAELALTCAPEQTRERLGQILARCATKRRSDCVNVRIRARLDAGGGDLASEGRRDRDEVEVGVEQAAEALEHDERGQQHRQLAR